MTKKPLRFPDPELEQLDDARLLLILLSFLGPAEVPLDLLVTGPSPRKRWSELPFPC
jgi:hypothetical protein